MKWWKTWTRLPIHNEAARVMGEGRWGGIQTKRNEFHFILFIIIFVYVLFLTSHKHTNMIHSNKTFFSHFSLFSSICRRYKYSSPKFCCRSWQKYNVTVSGSKWAFTGERLKMENNHYDCTLFKRNSTCTQPQSKFSMRFFYTIIISFVRCSVFSVQYSIRHSIQKTYFILWFKLLLFSSRSSFLIRW